MPSRSAISQCGRGANEGARGVPPLRTSSFAASSDPSGTEPSSTFGTSASSLSISSSSSGTCAPSLAIRASSSAIRGRSSAAAVFLSLARPISAVSAFFSALSDSAAVIAARRYARAERCPTAAASNGSAMRAMRPGETFDLDRLLAPAEAVAAYLDAVAPQPLGSERVPLERAFGRILARDALADGWYPADRRSTMDGYAVRSADGGAPRRIAGSIRMGHPPPGRLGAGEAMRIPTGGVLPAEADAVVPLEDASGDDEQIVPAATPLPGEYVTPRGEDMTPGDRVLRPGTRIGAPALSVLATLGITEPEVFLRPRVAVVSTGDELVDAGTAPRTGQVRDSNRWAIAGCLAALGCEVLHLPRAEDEVDAILRGIAAGLEAADAVVLTGGSSVGARDHVPAAIDRLGAPGVLVHGVRVKPGKPTILAAVGRKPVIGLD